jgi:hypothetical protein
MYYESCNSSSKHVDIKSSEDGELTETCKGSKYIRIETRGTELVIIL